MQTTSQATLWNHPLKQMQHWDIFSEKVNSKSQQEKVPKHTLYLCQTLNCYQTLRFFMDSIMTKKLRATPVDYINNNFCFVWCNRSLKKNKHHFVSIISYPDVSCTPAVVSSPEFMSYSILAASHQLVSEFSCLPCLRSILEQDQKISAWDPCVCLTF